MLTSNEQNPPERKASLKDKFRHAFAIGSEYEAKLEEDEERLLRDIALNIHKRKLAAVAIPFLLFHKPLNVIGANAIQMGEVLFTMGPVEGFLRRFLGKNYTHELLVRTLEKRCSIERLVEFLEAHIEERSREERV
jgi:hypothetical protein